MKLYFCNDNVMFPHAIFASLVTLTVWKMSLFYLFNYRVLEERSIRLDILSGVIITDLPGRPIEIRIDSAYRAHLAFKR